ncbi:hypothetical protein, partial [Nocardia amamiensis]|uniref:hypothetical protein n=1 Tax=Nocardia amamiensis TaxID=404578 RepID=UPI000A6B7A82
MTAPVYIKRYRDPARAAAAAAHHAWLAGLGVRVPALLEAAENVLVFEHLGDCLPGPQDLV